MCVDNIFLTLFAPFGQTRGSLLVGISCAEIPQKDAVKKVAELLEESDPFFFFTVVVGCCDTLVPGKSYLSRKRAFIFLERASRDCADGFN